MLFKEFAHELQQEVNEVNFPSTEWLNYMRTQLKLVVGGVCLRSNGFFLGADH